MHLRNLSRLNIALSLASLIWQQSQSINEPNFRSAKLLDRFLQFSQTRSSYIYYIAQPKCVDGMFRQDPVLPDGSFELQHHRLSLLELAPYRRCVHLAPGPSSTASRSPPSLCPFEKIKYYVFGQIYLHVLPEFTKQFY